MLITKNQLKFGDILVTKFPDNDIFKYYIFCNTPLGVSFVSAHGHNSYESYNENLEISYEPSSSFSFIKVFRPCSQIAHRWQNQLDSFEGLLKVPIEEMIRMSVDISNFPNYKEDEDGFINIEYYV